MKSHDPDQILRICSGTMFPGQCCDQRCLLQTSAMRSSLQAEKARRLLR